MKKLITLACCAAAFNAQAQTRQFTEAKGLPIVSKVQKYARRGTGAIAGQILPVSFTSASSCNNSLYFDQNGGYVTGNNSYGDKEKLMSYDLADYGAALPARVDTAYAYFAAKYVSANASVTAKIYSANASGEPGTLLGTSTGKQVSTLDTTGYPTKFIFSSPVTLTNAKFFVSIDVSALYAAHDTVGILSTEDGCADTDDNSAWEKASDNTYGSIFDDWQELSLDMGIFSYVTASPVGISNVVENKFNAVVYPVPAASSLGVSFTGQENANTVLNLKDITGKTVASTSLQTIKGGNYKTSFDVSSFSRGLYFVELLSGHSRGMIKVSIQ